MRESIQNQHKNTWACTTSLGILQFVSHRTEKNSIISHPPSQTITKLAEFHAPRTSASAEKF